MTINICCPALFFIGRFLDYNVMFSEGYKKLLKRIEFFLESGILEDLRPQIYYHGILTLSMRLILSRVYELGSNLLYHMLRNIPEGLLSFEGRRFTSDGVTPTLIGSIPMANEGAEDVSSLVGTILRFWVTLVDTIIGC